MMEKTGSVKQQVGKHERFTSPCVFNLPNFPLKQLRINRCGLLEAVKLNLKHRKGLKSPRTPARFGIGLPLAVNKG